MYMMPMPIFLPISEGKGGKCKNNKFSFYGILLLVGGIFIAILSILLYLLFEVELLEPYKALSILLLWMLLTLCLFFASELYKNQTDKEMFESIGRDFIRLCNLSIISSVVVIGIMIYDMVTQKEVITLTISNLIMWSAIILNTIRLIICKIRKKK